jgi:hypothetical protein
MSRSLHHLRRSKTATKTPRKPLKPHLYQRSAAEKAKAPGHREVVVAKGDTLSTLFEKVGLPGRLRA